MTRSLKLVPPRQAVAAPEQGHVIQSRGYRRVDEVEWVTGGWVPLSTREPNW